MKKIVSLSLVLVAVLGTTKAQASGDEAKWTKKTVSGLNLSQTSLTNWAAGGENSVSWNVYLNSTANYKDGAWSWDNALVADFGQTYTSSNKWQKSVDKLNLNTKAGYAIAKHWNGALLLDFLTQFDEGYKSATARNNKEKYISKFLAPAYISLSLGADYKPSKNFSLLVSPVAGKFTIVTDKFLSDAGAYGVKPGKNVLAELGASLVTNYSRDITKDISMQTKLTLFSAYNNNFGNIDVNWDLMINFKVNKFITANVTTNLIYDDDIKSVDGGPKVQLREIIGLGVSYTF